jgi:hypothetical protein
MERHQRAQHVLAWIVLLGAALQFFLAGLAVFRAKPHDNDKLFESSAFDVHRVVGYAVILVAFALLVQAIINRERIRLALVLFVLTLIQLGLAEAGHSVAALGGLHPVNGLLILGFAHMLTRAPGAKHERRGGADEQPRPAETPAAAD